MTSCNGSSMVQFSTTTGAIRMSSASRTTADIRNRKLKRMIKNRLLSGISLLATVILALSPSEPAPPLPTNPHVEGPLPNLFSQVTPATKCSAPLPTFSSATLRFDAAGIAFPDGGNEYLQGIGFGLDKVQHRHNIGASPYSTSAALTAVKWALESERYSAPYNTGWGSGRTIYSTAQLGKGCKRH